ncbi:MAG: extracellular solute-binding protein [Gorillibacterium sp.]|nr:extracellular solute-binding protein [Gorillibacterium sp.]
MKQRNGLVTMLAAVFLVGSMLTGCSKGGNEESTATAESTTAATAGAATTGTKTYDKKLTLNLGMFDVTDLDDEMSKFVEEKFNVELKLTQVSWDSWAEQVNLLTASGDMPDVLVYDMKPENLGQYKKFVTEGVIRDIPVLDDKYPNLAKLRDTMPVVEPWKIDGKLYAWPKPRGENPYNLNSTQVVVYRQDWAKKLGLDKAEFTAEDVYQLAKAMKEQDPGGNGAGKTVGYGDVGWGFGYLANAFSNTPDYMKVDGKYIWTQTLPEKLEGVKFLNKMYQEGVYWKDFFTAKDNDSRSLFVSGLMGVYEDNLGIAAYNNLKKDFVTANPTLNPDEAFKIMTIKGNDGKMFNQEWDNYWSATIFSTKVDDEKMARLLDIMDWSVTDEGKNFFFYGMKGKDWDDASGKVEVKWTKDENGKAKAPTYNGIQLRTLAALNGDFQAVNPDVADSTKNEVFNMLKSQTDTNTNLVKLDYDYSYFSAPNKDKYGNFASDKEAALKKIVVSSKDVEKDWNAWLKSMEPKVQKVLDELNSMDK